MMKIPIIDTIKPKYILSIISKFEDKKLNPQKIQCHHDVVITLENIKNSYRNQKIALIKLDTFDRDFLIQLLNFFYKNLKLKKRKTLYELLLSKVYDLYDIKEYMDVIKELRENYGESFFLSLKYDYKIFFDDDFKTQIFNILNDYTEFNEFKENMKKKLNISSVSKLGGECIAAFTKKQIIKGNIFENNSSLITPFIKLDDPDGVFCKKVLVLLNPHKINDEKHSKWFEIIKKKHGMPDENDYIWKKISYKDKFLEYFKRKEINKLFSNYNKERARFWANYVDSIIDIKFIEKANKAVLMITDKDDLFIEFLQTGNAFFWKKIISKEALDKLLIKIDNTYSNNVKTQLLKNKNDKDIIFVKKYAHGRGWEDKFEKELKYEGGYKPRY